MLSALQREAAIGYCAAQQAVFLMDLMEGRERSGDGSGVDGLMAALGPLVEVAEGRLRGALKAAYEGEPWMDRLQRRVMAEMARREQREREDELLPSDAEAALGDALGVRLAPASPAAPPEVRSALEAVAASLASDDATADDAPAAAATVGGHCGGGAGSPTASYGPAASAVPVAPTAPSSAAAAPAATTGAASRGRTRLWRGRKEVIA